MMPMLPASATALVKQMAVHLLAALCVCLGVVVLASAAGIVRLQDLNYALTAGLLRFGRLFWPCLVVVLAGDLLVLWGFQRGWAADRDTVIPMTIRVTMWNKSIWIKK